MATLDIKLDAEAMTALFPEGSAVRLELQQTVMNEIVRKVIDRNVTSLKAAIDEAVRVQYIAALAAQGISVAHSRLNLSADVKAAINEHARACVLAATNKAVQEVAEPELASIRRKLTEALDNGLRVQLQTLARTAMKEAFK